MSVEHLVADIRPTEKNDNGRSETNMQSQHEELEKHRVMGVGSQDSLASDSPAHFGVVSALGGLGDGNPFKRMRLEGAGEASCRSEERELSAASSANSSASDDWRHVDDCRRRVVCCIVLRS